MPRVLHVAEKPSVANELSKLLCRGGTPAKRAGRSKYNPIFDFASNLRGQACEFVVTSVTGHLMELDFTTSHRSWQSCDPEELFDAPVVKFVPPGRTDLKHQIETEARRCDWLVLWLDCDREGENIALEVLQVCRAVNPRIKAFRARFSSLVPAEIHRACERLVDLDVNAAAAVDARQELDLRIGAAVTRFLTFRLRAKLGGAVAPDDVVSYGPCQFPTLGFIVERFWEIEAFSPEPFWSIRAVAQRGESEATFTWRRVRLFDRLCCFVLYEGCLKSPVATVTSVVSKPKRKFRPFPLTTVSLQKLAAKKLRMSSEKAMSVAEKIYQRGFISYPRTETDAFPNGFDFRSLVEQQRSSPAWGTYAAKLFGPEAKFKTPKAGQHNDHAHPPIHPTKPGAELAGEEARVYELVARHFLACCSDDAIGQETLIEIDIGGEAFHTSGLMIEALNYLEVYPYDKWSEKSLPVFRQGEKFEPSSIEMTSGCTSPPKLLSEPELITLMDKNGIGTDATIAEHIAKIQERGYAQKDPAGLFSPTPLGVGLIEGYDSMGLPEMSKPQFRAETEADMAKIAAGAMTMGSVVRNTASRYRGLYQMASCQAWKIEESVKKRWHSSGGGGTGDVPILLSPPPPPPPLKPRGGISADVMNCLACGEAGHMARSCPNKTASRAGVTVGSSGFSKISASDRISRPAPVVAAAAGSVARTGNCFKCGQAGHWASECPNDTGGGSGFTSSSGALKSGIRKTKGTKRNYRSKSGTSSRSRKGSKAPANKRQKKPAATDDVDMADDGEDI